MTEAHTGKLSGGELLSICAHTEFIIRPQRAERDSIVALAIRENKRRLRRLITWMPPLLCHYCRKLKKLCTAAKKK
jgi:hypothetical protein